MIGLLLVLCSTASADVWSFTGMASGEDSVAGSFGRTVGESGKVGFSFLGTEVGDEDYRIAIGPYAAMKFDVPGLSVLSEEVETFAGGAMLYDFDSHRPMYVPFVGVLAFPERDISPIVVYRYQIFDGGIEGDAASFVEGSQVFAGLRILIK